MRALRYFHPIPIAFLLLLIAAAVFCIVQAGRSIDALGQNHAPIVGTSTPIVWVYDGDTIRVRLDGKLEDVRLLGIDTPEVDTPYTDAECFGQEASAYTKEQLVGTEVLLVRDSESENRDAYDRLLRYVFLPDGSLFNQSLIAEGYARAYRHATYTQKAAFFEAEQQAQEEGSGLWSVCE